MNIVYVVCGDQKMVAQRVADLQRERNASEVRSEETGNARFEFINAAGGGEERRRNTVAWSVLMEESAGVS